MSNSNSTKKASYGVIVALAAVIITLLIILISMESRGPKKADPVNTGAVIINSPADSGREEPTEAIVTPFITEAPTELPTEVPTEIPTEEPTPVPTEVPVTPTPSPKPRKIDGKTSANPNYEGKVLVALTFDDGPEEGTTEEMLNVLKKHNAKATFFVLGIQINKGDKYRALLKRASDEGHQIGNHSYSHKFPSQLTDEQLHDEVVRTSALIKEITGQTVTVFRVPGGNKSDRVKRVTGLPLVQWCIDPLDWMFFEGGYIRNYAKEHGISYSEAESAIIDTVLFEGVHTTLEGEPYYCPPVAYEMKHGSILLFHDIYMGSVHAVDRLLTFLEENYGNYVFLPFDEFILTENDEGPRQGVVYYNLWSTT
ncbi:MAG: polysaccharide deacetylase family protein [Clostridia bacterium]|nr:polysaccharide deacetylase family protein [Clostridia bacterium]MBQ3867175.1 polysaccharide deacetylase family protein [Clostridia bacterium]